MFAVILSILVSLNFFWSKPLVPGYDSPFYLIEIRSFAQQFPDPTSYPYLNRYLTISFPATIARLFNVDEMTAYKIAVTIIYAMMALVLIRWFKNITNNSSAATLLSSAVIISPFLITYATTLFANFLAILFLFVLMMIESEKDLKYKHIYSILIFGLTLFVHNFSVAVIGLFVGTYLLLNKQWKIVLIVSIIAGYLIYSHKINLPSPVILGNESQRVWNAFLEHTGKYWLLYCLIMLGIFYKEIFKNLARYKIALAILLPAIVFSFQPLFGFNFLPERFVTFIVLASYFFYAIIISADKFKKRIVLLSIVPLFLNFLSADSLILNKGYRSISEKEMSFFGEVKNYVSKDDVILMSSNYEYWGKYVFDQNQIFVGDHFISCGTIKEIGYFGETNFTIGKLLGEKDVLNASNYLNTLKLRIPYNKKYILNDENLSCGNGIILTKLDNIKYIIGDNNLKLYEII